ncbi:MAG: phage tail protein [Jatrophihabitans sp.]
MPTPTPIAPMQLSPTAVGLLAQHAQHELAGAVPTKPRQTYGLSMNFSVTIGPVSLGDWQTCSGLKVEFSSKEIAVGGGLTRYVGVPDAIKYQKITLTRAMSYAASTALRNWLSSSAQSWSTNGARSLDSTCTISLRDDQRRPVADWTLLDVMPIAWTGPALTGVRQELAMETLELSHCGFL